MRRGARAADAIRLFALHSRKGAGDTQGNSSCRRTSGGAAGEARRRPLAPACVRLCALTSARAGDAARVLPPVTVRRLSPAVRSVRPTQAPCRCAARRMPTRRRRPDASITRHSPLATRHSPLATRHSPLAKRQAPLAKRHSPSATRQAPLAKRQAPSAKRQAPSAKRQAPSAKRQAPSAKRQAPSADRTSIVVIRSLRRACAASPPPSARRLPATQRSGRALCDGRAATRVAPVARLRVLPNLVDSESAQAT
ncbi:putative 60S ribosomal protein L19 [Burkholderia pseudomallei]|nr:putative 60S ribosomal protein L19 [Burkholderia pseudomallei]CAJ3578982.1 putative 60S ribosomal protein L19 [Burkholderia pseudomallei]CAJ4835446.1 putative 60S ribosomal protein L19 [Burkholderia pseudomallei]CAJ6117074.1 putative 60S ribosomal protein L19 [Burkholderia pseudomallei]CAJ6167506.1 putative 60S ribosomal protein L19 [Burkholderia pseudomallei]